jgi:hypothetical protein
VGKEERENVVGQIPVLNDCEADDADGENRERVTRAASPQQGVLARVRERGLTSGGEVASSQVCHGSGNVLRARHCNRLSRNRKCVIRMPASPESTLRAEVRH